MKQELLIQEVVEDFNTQQLAPLQKHMKVWQMLDDAIKTGKYWQCKNTYSVGKSQRCMIGLFMSYDGWNGLPEDKNYYITDRLNDSVFGGDYYFPESLDKHQYFDIIKKEYHKTGKIDQGIITRLNDVYGVTFDEFRDFFKGLDI